MRNEFRKILKGRNVNRKWIELPGRFRELLEDTIAGDSEAVAKAIALAIGEIKNNNYPAALKDFGGEIVMVGIDNIFNKINVIWTSCRVRFQHRV